LCATLNSRSFASCNHKVSIPNVGAEVGTEEGDLVNNDSSKVVGRLVVGLSVANVGNTVGPVEGIEVG
jgi:hypothetical protein